MEHVDLTTWPRREHFQFFSGLAFPFYNVTTSLDVTNLRRCAKAHGLSFYYALVYATLHVMNGIPDFLYKIRGGEVIKHDKLDPSFTVMGDNHLFKIVNAPFGGSMEEFCARCREAAAAQASPFPTAEDEGRDDLVYISSVPWFTFTGLTNEMDLDRDDSIPRVTWGKFTEQDSRWMLPYTVQLNHRLLDGYHINLLVNGVQAYLDELR